MTLAVAFYRNCRMLERQVQEWRDYPSGIKVIVVDDGSPEPAKPIIEANASPELLKRLRLYRITVDIPWNREEARNLAAKECSTDWLIQTDIDHLLPVESAAALLKFKPSPTHWYRFPRWRKGKADDTRRKDVIADHIEFGEIHPHVDSYLITRDLYWQVGGYDLTFSGCLGGGTDFLKRLIAVAETILLPPEIALHVYTRSEVKDASDWSLSRDRSEGKRREQMKRREGRTKPLATLISPWERQI